MRTLSDSENTSLPLVFHHVSFCNSLGSSRRLKPNPEIGLVASEPALRIQAGAVLNSGTNCCTFLPTMALGVTKLLYTTVHSDVIDADLLHVVSRYGCDGRVDTGSRHVISGESDQSVGRAFWVVQRHFVDLVVLVLKVDAEFPVIVLRRAHGGPNEVGGQKVGHVCGL